MTHTSSASTRSHPFEWIHKGNASPIVSHVHLAFFDYFEAVCIFILIEALEGNGIIHKAQENADQFVVVQMSVG